MSKEHLIIKIGYVPPYRARSRRRCAPRRLGSWNLLAPGGALRPASCWRRTLSRCQLARAAARFLGVRALPRRASDGHEVASGLYGFGFKPANWSAVPGQVPQVTLLPRDQDLYLCHHQNQPAGCAGIRSGTLPAAPETVAASLTTRPCQERRVLAFPCVSLSSERYEARARECEERSNNTRDVAVKPMLLKSYPRNGATWPKSSREHGE